MLGFGLVFRCGGRVALWRACRAVPRMALALLLRNELGSDGAVRGDNLLCKVIAALALNRLDDGAGELWVRANKARQFDGRCVEIDWDLRAFIVVFAVCCAMT